jgi:hypothetical protein
MTQPLAAPGTPAIAGADPHAQDPDKPLGPVNAALIAGGVGCLALGVLTTTAEASASVKDFLTLSDDVGPLSGKTVYAVVIWLLAWAILHALMRRSAVRFATAFTATLGMVGVGLLLTFPVIFQAFAP